MTDTIILAQLRIPGSLITEEIEGLYGSSILTEMSRILALYRVYDRGAEFPLDTNKDYMPSDLRYKEARKLINREARFLFSRHPDIQVQIPFSTPAQKEKADKDMTILQGYIDNVFEKTQFFQKLVKAARDCFIGKRVAWFANFNDIDGGITLDFVPSLEFVYDVDVEDPTKLTKLVTFYTINDSANKTEQRIYKKRYRMQNGTCYLYEAVYDGTGQEVEILTEDRPTKFSFIPGGVILNDGLTGDLDGESDIQVIQDYESMYSRIANADIDAERHGMNPIRWARDMSSESTKDLSIASGAFWDLASAPENPDGVTGEVGVLETSMGYTGAVNSTLARLRSTMFEEMDIPDTSAEALKGVISSGKTLEAIYWPLIVRCDEKMLVWRPAIRAMVDTLVQGAILYPKAARPYTEQAIPNTEYTVTVENQYPIPEDTEQEKSADLLDVNAQTMSKKAYMKKWRGLTDEEADQELEQIAKERELLEDSFGSIMPDQGGDFGAEDDNTPANGQDEPQGETEEDNADQQQDNEQEDAQGEE